MLAGFLVTGFFLHLNNCRAEEKLKQIDFIDDGLVFENINSRALTVKDFLDEQKIEIKNDDRIIPGPEEKVYAGSKIMIERAKKISLADGSRTSNIISLGKTVAGALWENEINLGEDDIVKPALDYPLQSGDKIEIIRVDIKEEKVNKSIPFATKSNEDDKLSWRTKKVTQKGENGINEITYKVVSYNGKEISRKILSQNKIKDPIPEIVTQGTYMKLGKAKAGQGTWYSFRGGLFAASTTLPRGAFAKVTNTENGKSVVVQINDFGPFGKGRVIDLDKPAFEKIASLGAGVADVKVEQILN